MVPVPTTQQYFLLALCHLSFLYCGECGSVLANVCVFNVTILCVLVCSLIFFPINVLYTSFHMAEFSFNIFQKILHGYSTDPPCWTFFF